MSGHSGVIDVSRVGCRWISYLEAGVFLDLATGKPVTSERCLNPKKHKRVQIFNEIHRDLHFFTFLKTLTAY